MPVPNPRCTDTSDVSINVFHPISTDGAGRATAFKTAYIETGPRGDVGGAPNPYQSTKAGYKTVVAVQE